jgi:hypothetical protein
VTLTLEMVQEAPDDAGVEVDELQSRHGLALLVGGKAQ